MNRATRRRRIRRQERAEADRKVRELCHANPDTREHAPYWALIHTETLPGYRTHHTTTCKLCHMTIEAYEAGIWRIVRYIIEEEPW